MKVRMFLALTLALALLAQPVAGQTVITYSAWGNTDEIAVEERLIRAFEAAHPDIKVELIVPVGSYSENLLVWVAGGTVPDVVTLNRNSYAQFAEVMQPYDPAGVDTSVYVSPALFEALNYNGNQIGLPKRMNTKVMIYDREAFDAAAVALPSGEWTPADYAEAARRLTRRSGDLVERWGSGPLVIWNWFTAFGAKLYSDDGKQALFTSPQVIEATEFMLGLHKEYAGWFDDFPNFNEALVTGRMAMFADVGPWYVPDLLANATFEWTIAPLPGEPLEPEMTGISISKSTEHYDAALKFATWVSTSPEAQEIIATGTNLPVTRDGVYTFVLRRPGANLEAFFDVFERGYQFQPLRQVPLPPGIDAIIWGKFYDEILVGKVDPITGLQELQNQVQGMLNQYSAQ